MLALRRTIVADDSKMRMCLSGRTQHSYMQAYPKASRVPGSVFVRVRRIQDQDVGKRVSSRIRAIGKPRLGQMEGEI